MTETLTPTGKQARLDWRLFWLLTGAGAFGAVALAPLFLTVQRDTIEEAGAPFVAVAVVQVLQISVLVVLGVLAGLRLGSRIRLGAPLLAQWVRGIRDRQAWKAIVPPALTVGLVGSLAVLALDVTVFLPRIEGLEPLIAPLWQRLLASLYGGITEELLLRFGLFSLLAFTLTRFVGPRQGLPGTMVLWTVNLVVAVVFGLTHLPATAPLVEITPIVVSRALILNGILGLGFGYLYWSRGLEAAILAHFSADVVLQIAAGFA